MYRLAILALACLAPAAAAPASPSGAAKLADEIDGRLAGSPLRCIDTHRMHGTRIIEHNAIIYDAGSTIYVNKPRRGSGSLNRWDVLVTRTANSRLCRADVVELRDSSTGMLSGLAVLGDFIPYRKAMTGRR